MHTIKALYCRLIYSLYWLFKGHNFDDRSFGMHKIKALYCRLFYSLYWLFKGHNFDDRSFGKQTMKAFYCRLLYSLYWLIKGHHFDDWIYGMHTINSILMSPYILLIFINQRSQLCRSNFRKADDQKHFIVAFFTPYIDNSKITILTIAFSECRR
jgi:hypothetical protein